MWSWSISKWTCPRYVIVLLQYGKCSNQISGNTSYFRLFSLQLKNNIRNRVGSWQNHFHKNSALGFKQLRHKNSSSNLFGEKIHLDSPQRRRKVYHKKSHDILHTFPYTLAFRGNVQSRIFSDWDQFLICHARNDLLYFF